MNPSETALPPATCGVAFKEWEGVCEALALGRQSVILRKGGIEEGPGGFVPEHDAFWLYPTRVHQAQQGLKDEARGLAAPGTEPGLIGLRALAVVDVVGRVDDEATLADLDALHVWTAETVGTRFHYKRPGVWVLGVRVFRRETPFEVPVTPDHAGCKTWVPLHEALPTAGLTPALGVDEFAAGMDRLRAALGSGAGR